jgi:hypothetical protein
LKPMEPEELFKLIDAKTTNKPFQGLKRITELLHRLNTTLKPPINPSRD